jgi:hypothetical protein
MKLHLPIKLFLLSGLVASQAQAVPFTFNVSGLSNLLSPGALVVKKGRKTLELNGGSLELRFTAAATAPSAKIEIVNGNGHLVAALQSATQANKVRKAIRGMTKNAALPVHPSFTFFPADTGFKKIALKLIVNASQFKGSEEKEEEVACADYVQSFEIPFTGLRCEIRYHQSRTDRNRYDKFQVQSDAFVAENVNGVLTDKIQLPYEYFIINKIREEKGTCEREDAPYFNNC